MSDDLDSLLAQAEGQPFSGWDFSWPTGRVTEQPPPWDYTALVAERARRSPDLLDLGTGGGEWLAGLPSTPAALALRLLVLGVESGPGDVGAIVPRPAQRGHGRSRQALSDAGHHARLPGSPDASLEVPG